MDVFLKYWPLLAAALQVLALWVMWSMRQFAANEIRKSEEASKARDSVLDDKIDGHNVRITALAGRVDAVEDDIGNLPTKADLARVEGEVKVVLAQVENVAAGVRRLEDYAMASSGAAR